MGSQGSQAAGRLGPPGSPLALALQAHRVHPGKAAPAPRPVPPAGPSPPPYSPHILSKSSRHRAGGRAAIGTGGHLLGPGGGG